MYEGRQHPRGLEDGPEAFRHGLASSLQPGKRCLQHPRFGCGEGWLVARKLRAETEGGTTVNELLVEENPEVGTGAARAAGEACALNNYLVEPDESMDERIAAAKRRLGARRLCWATITSATR